MTQITCDGSTQGVPQVVILAQQQLRWFKAAGYYICAGPIGVQVIEVEEIDKEPAPVACRTWSEVGPDAAKAIIDDAHTRLISLVLDHAGAAAGADPQCHRIQVSGTGLASYVARPVDVPAPSGGPDPRGLHRSWGGDQWS